MLFPTLMNRQRRARRRPARPLLLEWLEPRNLLSVLNVNTDTDLSAPHNETSIAVNPTNPLNLIGSANDYQYVYSSSGGVLDHTLYSRAHVTFDGGQTWTDYVVPFNTSLYKATGDPAVAFDAVGTAYLGTLGFSRLPNGDLTPPDLQVAHSPDGGQSWSVPVLVAAGSGSATGAEVDNDKPYIAAWGHGNAIVTWTEVIYGNNHNFKEAPIFASVTHDGGNTWTVPIQISAQKLGFVDDGGSVPVVAADGNIYVALLSAEQFGTKIAHNQYLVVKVDPATGKAVKDPNTQMLVLQRPDKLGNRFPCVRTNFTQNSCCLGFIQSSCRLGAAIVVMLPQEFDEWSKLPVKRPERLGGFYPVAGII